MINIFEEAFKANVALNTEKLNESLIDKKPIYEAVAADSYETKFRQLLADSDNLTTGYFSEKDTEISDFGFRLYSQAAAINVEFDPKTEKYSVKITDEEDASFNEERNGRGFNELIAELEDLTDDGYTWFMNLENAFDYYKLDESIEEDLLVRGEDGKLTTTSQDGRWGNSKEWDYNNESLEEDVNEVEIKTDDEEIEIHIDDEGKVDVDVSELVETDEVKIESKYIKEEYNYNPDYNERIKYLVSDIENNGKLKEFARDLLDYSDYCGELDDDNVELYDEDLLQVTLYIEDTEFIIIFDTNNKSELLDSDDYFEYFYDIDVEDNGDPEDTMQWLCNNLDLSKYVIDLDELEDEEIEEPVEEGLFSKSKREKTVALGTLDEGDRFSKNGYKYLVVRVDGDQEDFTVKPYGKQNPEDDVNSMGYVLMRGSDSVTKIEEGLFGKKKKPGQKSTSTVKARKWQVYDCWDKIVVGEYDTRPEAEESAASRGHDGRYKVQMSESTSIKESAKIIKESHTSVTELPDDIHQQIEQYLGENGDGDVFFNKSEAEKCADNVNNLNIDGLSAYVYQDDPEDGHQDIWYVLFNYSATSNPKLKHVRIPDGITEISAFKHNGIKSNVTSVEIPDSVKIIGYEAFMNRKNLKNVNIPNSVTEIGDFAFYGCESLESVEIPDSVKHIGEHAFSECHSLKTVRIGNGVEKIDKYAFFKCNHLKNVIIGNNVTTIGGSAFGQCESLESIYIPNNVTHINSFAFFSAMSYHEPIIKCNKGSYAEQFAKEHGYQYELIDSIKIEESVALNKIRFTESVDSFQPEDELMVVYNADLDDEMTEEEIQAEAESLIGCDICKCGVCGANYVCKENEIPDAQDIVVIDEEDVEDGTIEEVEETEEDFNMEESLLFRHLKEAEGEEEIADEETGEENVEEVSTEETNETENECCNMVCPICGATENQVLTATIAPIEDNLENEEPVEDIEETSEVAEDDETNEEDVVTESIGSDGIFVTGNELVAVEPIFYADVENLFFEAEDVEKFEKLGYIVDGKFTFPRGTKFIVGKEAPSNNGIMLKVVKIDEEFEFVYEDENDERFIVVDTADVVEESKSNESKKLNEYFYSEESFIHMCSKEEWEKFKAGELLYDLESKDFITVNAAKNKGLSHCVEYDRYEDYEEIEKNSMISFLMYDPGEEYHYALEESKSNTIDLDESSLNRLFTKFARENYENVVNVRINDGKLVDGQICLEGYVRTTSGVKRDIKLVSEGLNISENTSKVKIIEKGPFTEGAQVKSNRCPFVLECKVSENKMSFTGLKYNYIINESKESFSVSGKVSITE